MFNRGCLVVDANENKIGHGQYMLFLVEHARALLYVSFRRVQMAFAANTWFGRCEIDDTLEKDRGCAVSDMGMKRYRIIGSTLKVTVLLVSVRLLPPPTDKGFPASDTHLDRRRTDTR